MAVAIAAALLSATGNGVWLGVLRRAASHRRQLVLARLADQAGRSTASPAAAGDAGEAVMVPGLTMRHRPDCALVAGKAVVPATAEAEPCGWCSE